MARLPACPLAGTSSRLAPPGPCRRAVRMMPPQNSRLVKLDWFAYCSYVAVQTPEYGDAWLRLWSRSRE